MKARTGKTQRTRIYIANLVTKELVDSFVGTGAGYSPGAEHEARALSKKTGQTHAALLLTSCFGTFKAKRWAQKSPKTRN